MRKNKVVIAITVVLFLAINGCSMKKEQPSTLAEVLLGSGIGAVTGQLIVSSTPATLAAGLIGALFGMAIIELSENDVEEVVESEPYEEEITLSGDYHIYPVNAYTSGPESQRVVYCREAKAQRVDASDNQIYALNICRDQDRWFLHKDSLKNLL